MHQPLPANPFPGLRPFEADEEPFFFGRELEIDELLRRLRFHRFLAVVGTSGCGKSSLIRSGLLPALESGQMVKASSSWRIGVMRPGADPIGRLAQALCHPDVLGTPMEGLDETARVLVEATLRRGSLGLADAVRQARLPADDNILVVVDQFEELFRFRRRGAGSRDEAVAFVRLLVEAARQTALPVYVVITMRSDFIGDCMEYPGLPEALNQSQYFVPRMTRDALRSAITGPVAVAGAQIAPRLVMRLLNDLGDNQDDLPVLQHALMRTWQVWAATGSGTPIDLSDYEAAGTLRHALSQHAEEAFAETGADRTVVERMFKALTDTYTDPRGIRRPTTVAALASIAGAEEGTILRLVEIFRRPGRSFLMPPPDVPLHPSTVVDISHESLMRRWTRLVGWAAEERAAAEFYVRLAREASWHDKGEAGLWGDPEVELGLRWRRETQPTAAWARRYDEAFDRAIGFLDASERERARQRSERRAHRIRRLVYAWTTAAVLALFALWAAYAAWVANRERSRAEANLGLARAAVDQTLLSTERDPAALGADVPQMRELRRELLEKARPFYEEFIAQDPDNDDLRYQQALAHDRLGDIHRALDRRDEAARAYEAAIALLAPLGAAFPDGLEYTQALANAYNDLGETWRMVAGRRADADRAYGEALRLQSALVDRVPTMRVYQQELARTYYNRGILYGQTAEPGGSDFRRAEDDFRRAIDRLTPLAADRTDLAAVQGLARAENNLASLVAADDARIAEARPLYERAVALHEALVAARPDNREYKLELAKFANNLADLYRRQQQLDLAERSSQQARSLLDDLVRPAPSLGIEQADAATLRGHILQSRGAAEAVSAYALAFQRFLDLERAAGALSLPDYHLRFGDLLVNMSALRASQPRLAGAEPLLADAARAYLAMGERALATGRRDDARMVSDSFAEIWPTIQGALGAARRSTLAAAHEDLEARIRAPRSAGGID
jgi:tetratricopeptide (TPR) repeat protein